MFRGSIAPSNCPKLFKLVFITITTIYKTSRAIVDIPFKALPYIALFVGVSLANLMIMYAGSDSK